MPPEALRSLRWATRRNMHTRYPEPMHINGNEQEQEAGVKEEIGMNEGASACMLDTDAWALGCVAFFCRWGRPLFFGTPDDVATQHETEKEACSRLKASSSGSVWPDCTAGLGGRQRDEQHQHNHVQFHDATHADAVEGAAAAESLSDDLQALMHSLLAWEPHKRCSVRAAAAHRLFRSSGSVHTLHLSEPIELPSLPAGNNSSHDIREGDDGGGWRRRQCSMVWAPLEGDFERRAMPEFSSGDSEVDSSSGHEIATEGCIGGSGTGDHVSPRKLVQGRVLTEEDCELGCSFYA